MAVWLSLLVSIGWSALAFMVHPIKRQLLRYLYKHPLAGEIFSYESSTIVHVV